MEEEKLDAPTILNTFEEDYREALQGLPAELFPRAASMASTLTPCNTASIQSLIVSEAKPPCSPIPPQSCNSSFTFEA